MERRQRCCVKVFVFFCSLLGVTGAGCGVILWAVPPAHQGVSLTLWALASLSVAAGVSVVTMRRFRDYFDDLTATAAALEEGRYRPTAGARRQDDAGRFAQYLDHLARKLAEHEQMWGAMDKMMPRAITKENLKGKGAGGGEVRFATVFFTDIRGFSAIAETLEPRQLVAFLNEHLTLISKIVEKNHGLVDKYIGDSVMGLFGAPVSHGRDVDNALVTARDIQRALHEINQRLVKEGKTPVKVSMGLNTGPVIAGQMGSEERLSYTVLGDTVNLASRMEGLTRLYNVNCLVSEFTQHESKGDFVFRELDLVRVKGRSGAVRLYELLDEAAWNGDTAETLQKFQNARQFYLLRDWQRAEILFQQVLELKPEDGPSRLYLSRIDELERTPPPASWDGIYTAATKG